jgi:hypothetical protein
MSFDLNVSSAKYDLQSEAWWIGFDREHTYVWLRGRTFSSLSFFVYVSWSNLRSY